MSAGAVHPFQCLLQSAACLLRCASSLHDLGCWGEQSDFVSSRGKRTSASTSGTANAGAGIKSRSCIWTCTNTGSRSLRVREINDADMWHLRFREIQGQPCIARDLRIRRSPERLKSILTNESHAHEWNGRIKEAVGALTGSTKLRKEGRADQNAGQEKQVVEANKAVNDAKDESASCETSSD